VLLVNGRHQSRRRRKRVVDKDENRLFSAQFNALSNDVHELPDGEIGGDEVLLLIQRRNVRLFRAFDDDRDSVAVLAANARRLSRAFVCDFKKCIVSNSDARSLVSRKPNKSDTMLTMTRRCFSSTVLGRRLTLHERSSFVSPPGRPRPTNETKRNPKKSSEILSTESRRRSRSRRVRTDAIATRYRGRGRRLRCHARTERMLLFKRKLCRAHGWTTERGRETE